MWVVLSLKGVATGYALEQYGPEKTAGRVLSAARKALEQEGFLGGVGYAGMELQTVRRKKEAKQSAHVLSLQGRSCRQSVSKIRTNQSVDRVG